MDGPSFRLDEWLTYRRVSRSEWYRLKAANNAPETYGRGRMQRITFNADRRWIQKQKRLARAGKPEPPLPHEKVRPACGARARN
jgi:hypothetical protein